MDAVEYLTTVAVAEACRAGWEYRIERSRRSEAVYVKLRRGTVWHGLRIAAHGPVYGCSADYELVTVPREVAGVVELTDAEAAVVAAVRGDGRVIADPEETDAALLRAWRDRRDGATAAGPDGTTWRWNEETLRWRPIAERQYGRPPVGPPPASLPPQVESAIRHRLNTRARWAAEEAARWAARRLAEPPG